MPLSREALSEQFPGEIVLPGDPGYAELTFAFGAPSAPAAVLLPRAASEVAAALSLARQLGLPLAVRSGGHSNAGLSTNQGGLVINLSRINTVEIIDAKKRIVRVGAGATWGQVAETLRPHKLAISSGDTRSVGVGGLTLGGGIGWMVRKYGLALDQLHAAELVTSAGQVLEASRQENPDLFWALRGAGSNFGVVTYFEFEAQRVDKVTYATIMYPLDNLSALLTAWRDSVRASSEDLSSSFSLLPSFGEGDPPKAMVLACYAGNQTEAEPHLAPLRQLGPLMFEDIKEVDYAEVLEEGQPPESMQIVVKNTFYPTLTAEVIEAIAAAQAQPGMRVFQLRHLGGACQRVAADETAYAFRDSEIMMFVASFFPGEATPAEIDAGLQAWRDVAALGRGSYINFLSTATAEDVAAIYPVETRQRLADLKRVYDPDNLFRSNYNILSS